MNYRGYRRIEQWAAFIYYPSSCVEGLRKTTMKDLTQGSLFPANFICSLQTTSYGVLRAIPRASFMDSCQMRAVRINSVYISIDSILHCLAQWSEQLDHRKEATPNVVLWQQKACITPMLNADKSFTVKFTSRALKTSRPSTIECLLIPTPGEVWGGVILPRREH
jgi:hypothetical protein